MSCFNLRFSFSSSFSSSPNSSYTSSLMSLLIPFMPIFSIRSICFCSSEIFFTIIAPNMLPISIFNSLSSFLTFLNILANDSVTKGAFCLEMYLGMNAISSISLSLNLSFCPTLLIMFSYFAHNFSCGKYM